MERLTERDEYGNADIIALSEVMPELYAELNFSETNALTAVLNRLASYEDTNLEPEWVMEFAKAEREGRYIMLKDAEKAGVNRLRELAQADRDGRCAVLPVKPGDIVTCIWYGIPIQAKVKRVTFYWVGDEIDWYAITTSTTGSKECFGKEDWGKTVFPTREAAEEALKAREQNERVHRPR